MRRLLKGYIASLFLIFKKQKSVSGAVPIYYLPSLCMNASGLVGKLLGDSNLSIDAAGFCFGVYLYLYQFLFYGRKQTDSQTVYFEMLILPIFQV